MKALFFIRSLECGGAERQLVLLTNELGRRGHDVAIAVFRRGGVRERDIDASRVRLLDLGLGSRWDFGLFYLRLCALVRRERPAALHGYLSAGNLAAAAAAPWAPGVRVVWGIRDSNMDMKRYSRATRFYHAVSCRMAFAADAIVVNSMAGLRHAESLGLPSAKLLHVPNGIDTDAFAPDPEGGARVRAECGIAGTDRLIAMVGRLDPMKGHEVFLRAATMVASADSRARFACIGSGAPELRRRLEEQAAQLLPPQRLFWLPERADMRAVYSAMDVFCSASVFGEGFPNVLAEAMACGRTCVATDVGDAAYVAGAAARIVPPGDPRALATALLEGLAAPAAGLEGRKRIASLFSVSRLADRTEAVLAGGSRTHPSESGSWRQAAGASDSCKVVTR
jgi:glycosyltransferase involved in cell wall biosynthesis